jgi:hypothetical protein
VTEAGHTRREYKYLLPARTSVAHVRALVPSLRIEYAPRLVSSVYFDTNAYETFEQSNSGMSQRTKLRLRWYGDLRLAARPVVELKHRLNHQGSKVQYPLGPIDFGSTTWAAVRAMMLAGVAGTDRLLVEALRVPILIASYHRHYLVSNDRRLRVTLDTGLRFFDQRHRPAPNLRFDTVRAHLAVLECKMDEAVHTDETRILEPLKVRWTRFSKYCYGLGELSSL